MTSVTESGNKTFTNTNQSTIVRSKRGDEPFVILNKIFLKDVKLTWQAKGLLAYLLSLPDDWKIYIHELVNHAANGIDSLRSILKELRAAGYVRLKRRVDPLGRVQGWDYYVFDKPETEKPDLGLPDMDSPDVGSPDVENPTLLSNELTKDLRHKEKKIKKSEDEVFSPGKRKILKSKKLTPKQEDFKSEKNVPRGALHVSEEEEKEIDEIYEAYGAAQSRNKKSKFAEIYAEQRREGIIPAKFDLLTKIEEFKQSLNPKDNNQFKPGIQVWFNQKRWKDTFEPFKPKPEISVSISQSPEDKKQQENIYITHRKHPATGELVPINQLDRRKPQTEFSGRAFRW